MTSLAFVSLLLVATAVSSGSAQGGIGNCCRRVSDRQVHRDNLESYYVQQTTSCPVHAVVFTTINRKKICADPGTMWTETSKAYIDGKNWQKQVQSRRRR